jgi:hypothetical protein
MLVALALVPLAIVAIRPVRESVMRAAGWALAANDEPIATADITACSKRLILCKAASQSE